VDDVDVDVARLVLGELLGPAEVDDPRHPVVRERVPARVRELAHVVGAHDAAGHRLAAALERQSAEVAHVEAAVPLEFGHGRAA
jgi:hypothetical protein